MLWQGRADFARWIGRRCRNRPAKGRQKRAGNRVLWHTNSQCLLASRDQRRNPCVSFQRQHQGKRTGPEGAGQNFGVVVPVNQIPGHCGVSKMHDQWVKRRPPLGFVYTRDRAIVARIRAQPIDCFGGHRDQTTIAPDRRRAFAAAQIRVNQHFRKVTHDPDAAFCWSIVGCRLTLAINAQYKP